MGKGRIIEHLGKALYKVEVVFDGRDYVNQRIADIDSQISRLNDEIAGLPDGPEKSIKELQISSLEKSRQNYVDYFPEDREEELYCAEYLENLSGDVGLAEIPGEDQQLIIKPGYLDGAVFDKAIDGQLTPTIASPPESTWFNLAMLPGWQKFMPTYRFGKIVEGSIDNQNNVCKVCLEPAYSSQQNLDVNQNQGFTQCPLPFTVEGHLRFCQDNPLHPT